METFISFLPLVIYSLIGTGLFYARKITFNNQVALISLAIIAHIILEIFMGVWYIMLAQVLIAIVAFLLLVFFFGGKTSGETILTMVSVLALVPIPEGLIPLGITLFVVLIVTAISLKKQSESIKNLLLEVSLASGMGSGLPNYENLPNRSELSQDARRTSLLPYVAFVMSLASLYYLLRPLLLDS